MPGIWPPWQIALAVIKTNQPTACVQLSALPWTSVKVQHTASATARGRRESRSIKTCAMAGRAASLSLTPTSSSGSTAAASPPASPKYAKASTRSPASPPRQTRPADLAAAIRGHWGIEIAPHYIRDVTFAEEASTIHASTAPRAMATIRNLAIGTLKLLEADDLAKTRAIRHEPERALTILGITNDQNAQGT
ncbi:hypothetical protein [Streptomyces sp. NRRL S-646]|uniref:hypothetical protein n=1 Tax=Streptomyces sp. NRRL S-646 TaxID=1463917 RepID=UPI001F1E1CE2|nr:hypothetical protein [Streptomyces sp. NRRL S-646]